MTNDIPRTFYFKPDDQKKWRACAAQRAYKWQQDYPELFDDHDVLTVVHQPETGFVEWVVAIELFSRFNLCSIWGGGSGLFRPKNHEGLKARKVRLFQELVPDEKDRQFLVGGHDFHMGSPPDLLVYPQDKSRYFFVEVKGPGDRLRPTQKSFFPAIEKRLNVLVHTVKCLPETEKP
jgi:hypothetical protein